MLNAIKSVVEYATVPVVRRLWWAGYPKLSYGNGHVLQKFTAKGCFWRDVITKALVYDLRELNEALLDHDVVSELHETEDVILQDVVDLVQKVCFTGTPSTI